MSDLPAYVLDSFAFIAYLEDEPAAQRIQKVLKDAEENKCRFFVEKCRKTLNFRRLRAAYVLKRNLYPYT